MDTDPTLRSSLPLVPAGPRGLEIGRSAAARPATAEREQIAELAREFEAYFVYQLVRQMRQSMLDDEHGTGLGADTMGDTMDVELGRQIANTGGIGLAQVLQTALERQVSGGAAAATNDSPAASAMPLAGMAAKTAAMPVQAQALASTHATRIAATSYAAAPAAPSVGAAMPLPVGASLTSPFGWRNDPFDGGRRFHAGVDIRAAYGREVPAAGAGQVVFSGSEGGYGNTVIVEHEGGVRTRYAHLSSIQVEAGQRVEAGAIVGRVGSSGRSTGPHLHFEVLQNGHPVDPEVAATRYAGQLKLGGVVADSNNNQPSVEEWPQE